MDTICEYLKFDHQRCDDLFERVETSIAERNWKDGIHRFRLYDNLMRQHIRMEEKILLPAFAQAMAGSAGPISMLQAEHVRIHGLIERMWEAIREFNAIDFALHAETLTLLMQEHTMKEDDMLYPLLDRALGANSAKIVRAMAEFLQPEAPAPDLAAG
ncbi:hemerythrin domain-containing protein [Herbaspirillum sp. HC18]|nr:hemerythrin domain-containing protein [Herbaspirillum sp. HC18]